MDSYPGDYGQVLTNLFLNAVSHAFPNEQGGAIRIAVGQADHPRGVVELGRADLRAALLALDREGRSDRRLALGAAVAQLGREDVEKHLLPLQCRPPRSLEPFMEIAPPGQTTVVQRRIRIRGPISMAARATPACPSPRSMT